LHPGNVLQHHPQKNEADHMQMHCVDLNIPASKRQTENLAEKVDVVNNRTHLPQLAEVTRTSELLLQMRAIHLHF
jgi:hypothetical protein